jgi:hypothetical protein
MLNGSPQEDKKVNIVRFIRLAVVLVFASVFALVLAFVIANRTIIMFPRLADNHSHGWGAVLGISALALIRIVAWVFANKRVYAKIAGDPPSQKDVAWQKSIS